ncbi:hypothetical protein CMV_025139, partial [Castanea mollissima]
ECWREKPEGGLFTIVRPISLHLPVPHSCRQEGSGANTDHEGKRYFKSTMFGDVSWYAFFGKDVVELGVAIFRHLEFLKWFSESSLILSK